MSNFTVLIFLWVSFLYCFCDTTYELDIQGTSEHGYYVSVNVGSPLQKIKLLPDTGSGNLAIAVTPYNEGNSYFRFNESHTFVKFNTNVDIHYVEGHWSGFLGSDFLNFGTSHGSLIKSTIACMTNNDKVFDINSKFSGLLGLAYSSIASPNSSITPLIDIMVQTKNMTDIFAFNLCGPYFSTNEKETTCGKLHLGFMSKENFSDEVVYTPIVKEWFYEVIVVNLKVGSKKISDNCKEFNNPRSIIDTGTTRLHLPKMLYYRTVQEIKKSIEPSISDWYNETAACIPKQYFNISMFPVVTLSFWHSKNSSFDLIVSPELYLLHLKPSSNEDICFSFGFAISDVGTIIGSTILKGYYVIFDRSRKQIGFANSTSRNQTYFPIFVTSPKYTYDNMDLCKFENSAHDASISVGTILWLIIALGTAVWLLYMLIIWIRAYLIERSDFHSETSSLVDD